MHKTEVIFRQAIAYASGAMAINSILKPRRNMANYEPLPYILCLSFSIELLFKSLLSCYKKSTRGHDKGSSLLLTHNITTATSLSWLDLYASNTLVPITT